MKPILSILLLALTPLVAFSQSVKLPQEIRGNIGAFIKVPAETADKSVSWIALDAGLNLFPTELLKDTKTAVCISSVAGRYRLACVSAKGDVPSEFAQCVVIIGDAPPVPPGPGPNPPDPKPDGELVNLLQSAYTLDGKPAANLASLAAVYRNSSAIVNDAARKTPYDVFSVMKKSIGIALKEPDADKITILPSVRKAIAVELDKHLPLGPNSSQPLHPEMRTLISEQFSRIQKVLEVLK